MTVSRRGFLAGTALGFVPRRTRANDVDVAVVGAGAAGLAAAKALRQGGLTVVVLEARERIGGRAFTDASLGDPFDAGAHYIHWNDRNPWRGIAADSVLRSSTIRATACASIATGVRCRTTIVCAGAMPMPGSGRSSRPRVPRTAPLRTLSAARRRNSPTLRAASPCSPSARSRIASRSATTTSFGTRGNLVPAGGYGALVARYGADMPVRLGTPVSRLRWGDGRVAMETPRGTLTSEAAILTAPVGVLKGGGLAFDPDLPGEIAAALDGLHMGALTKIALRLDRARLGPLAATELVHVEEGGAITSFEFWPDGGNLVLAHLGGDRARALCTAGERAAGDAVAASLARMLGERVRAAVTGARLAGWWADPFALGSLFPRPARTPGCARTAAPADRRTDLDRGRGLRGRRRDDSRRRDPRRPACRARGRRSSRRSLAPRRHFVARRNATSFARSSAEEMPEKGRMPLPGAT